MRLALVTLSASFALVATADAEPMKRLPLDPSDRVAASSPVTTELAARMAADWALYPAPAWVCRTGIHTDALVSWHCSGTVPKDGKATKVSVQHTFAIEGGALVAVDFGKQIASWPHLVTMLKHTMTDRVCADAAAGIDVTDVGVHAHRTPDDLSGCLLGWSLLYPALVRDGVLARVAREVPNTEYQDRHSLDELKSLVADKDPTKAGLFVANPDDTVTYTAGELTWTAHDNGADLDADAAAAYALAYRGGGHTDWRLPNIAELAELSREDLAHRDPSDCTHGKNQLLITPLIHLSCGLVWSATIVPDQKLVAAFGFISGTARAAKHTDKKNYRVLLVRP